MNMAMTEIQQFDVLINGELVPAKGGYVDSVNPSTGEAFARIANANTDDILKAVAAARAAFDNGSWSGLSIAERGIFLKKITKSIRSQAKELAQLESLGTGKTLKQSTFIDIPTAADTFDYFGNINAELESKTNAVDAPVKSLTAFEPRGVVACIIPWNYPLIMAAWKLAPALMAGNTVVFKPSPVASASILELAKIIKQSGIPRGVVNIVPSNNLEASQNLIASEDVDMVSFTGGTETGQKVMASAAQTTKKVTLELGGKSPNIVFEDCHMEAAIGGTMSAIFMNQGQMCTAGSRLLLEDKIYDRFLQQLIDATQALKIGDPLDYETAFGPVISVEHRDRILKAVRQAVSDGASLVCGGKVPEGMSKGAYMEPTILTNVKNSMSIAQEEVFGPVLAVMRFSSSDEAIAIANDTQYGLAASLWTKDLKKADEVARKLRCGIVWVNTYGGFYNEASFGGYKKSGFGRELGLEGLLEYTQSKHICIDQTPGGKPLVSGWF